MTELALDYTGYDQFIGHDQRPANMADVLILDDSVFDRKRLKRALDKSPGLFTVTEIGSLQNLQESLDAKHFDILFVDYGLGDGNGLEALKIIQSSELNRNAFNIMVTGTDSSRLAVSALKGGFHDFVNKDDLSPKTLQGILFEQTRLRRGPDLNARAGRPTPYEKISSPAVSAMVEESLDSKVKVALEYAISRYRMDDMGDTLASLTGTYDEPDEFIFR